VVAFHHSPAGPFICTATSTPAIDALPPPVAVPLAVTRPLPGLAMVELFAGDVIDVVGAVPFEPPTARSYRKPSLDPIRMLPAESAAELMTYPLVWWL
jgi:hypothetical protein